MSIQLTNLTIIILIITIIFSVCGCIGEDKNNDNNEEELEKGFGNMTLSSPAFENGEKIPAKYTADGEDISPPLTFGEIPKNAQSLALIMDDPDAPGSTWVHWLVWNIPPDRNDLSEGEKLPFTHGTNDFGTLVYGGPSPPSGTHRYYFKLYALDIMLDLEEGATKKQLLEAMDGHELAKAVLMGKYNR